jgi:hypothetical protein
MKIIAVVDNKGHCFTTTVQAIARHAGCRIDVVPSCEYSKRLKASADDPYDLIYFRSWWPNLHPYGRTPWITTVTTGGDEAFRRLAGIRGEGAPFPRAVVTQNGAVHAHALSLGLSAAMIPNGVDGELYCPGERPEARLVGLAGSLSNAHKKVEKGEQFCEWAVAAAGMRFARASGIEHGRMPDWYRSLWAYCQPSAREGCSNSVFEAMSTGLPCLICKGVGYHGEMCRDARVCPDGEVLFVKRDEKDIALALAQLRDDGQLYARTSANARRFTEAHAWPIVAKRFEELFNWAAGAK